MDSEEKILKVLKDLRLKTVIDMNFLGESSISYRLVEKKPRIKLTELGEGILKEYSELENIIKERNVIHGLVAMFNKPYREKNDISVERKIYEKCVDYTFTVNELSELIKDIGYDHNFLLSDIRAMVAVYIRDCVLSSISNTLR